MPHDANDAASLGRVYLLTRLDVDFAFGNIYKHMYTFLCMCVSLVELLALVRTG